MCDKKQKYPLCSRHENYNLQCYDRLVWNQRQHHQNWYRLVWNQRLPLKMALFRKGRAHWRKFRHILFQKLKSQIHWLFVSKQKVALLHKPKEHCRKFRHILNQKLKSSFHELMSWVLYDTKDMKFIEKSLKIDNFVKG